ncbi:PfkB family carbohydrate kinase [Paenibacillus oleatilyticus]|uniref:PfkB family carbohydrate kinase n=1 Tax=Paenibacillus oleatilyticus TaxID=2594886 RepID=UPI001C1F6FC9|nr:PfkB family carbohydrate kinase [Paenibacillus oleatilyticus]MBU7316623.1 GH32 C-terminal domain-containing protein [Paenibacillus oleatilyticus]
MLDVTAIGEVLIDFTPAGHSDNGNELFERNPGGAPANVLSALAKWGRRTAFIGKVGNDSFGCFLKEWLQQAGIRTDTLVMTEEANTTLAFVHLKENGDRRFDFCRKPGADMLLEEREVDLSVVSGCKVFHFGSVSLTHEPSATATLKSAALAKASGALVTYDPNVRLALWDDEERAKRMICEGIAVADVVKMSQEELEFLTGTQDLIAGSLQLHRNYGLKLILVTLAEKGCFYRMIEAAGLVSGFPVEVMDTTGAGDAFLSAFIHGLLERGATLKGLEERELSQRIRFANAAGALTTMRRGAIPALPTLEDVHKLLNCFGTDKHRESYRPKLHYTPAFGWMNDPNGMVYFDGEYHLFYQYYPDATTWGPMHWGHAVSTDLVHWAELPIALEPDEHGAIFSGSAVVDWRDSTGFFSGGNGLVAIFTHADTNPETGKPRQRQSLAYSTDKGRTWIKYAGNPVLSDALLEDFRDPKVFLHEAKQQWTMVTTAADRVRFYASDDLKEWRLTGEFGGEGEGSHDGVWECPDLFELPVTGTQGLTKWVLIVSIGDREDLQEGSRTQYFIGYFDGSTFHNDNSPDTVLWLDHGRDNYAGVTWSDVPVQDGRRLFIGWMSNWKYANLTPASMWRSAMTLPRSLSLHNRPEGVRLLQEPVNELTGLRHTLKRYEKVTIAANAQVVLMPQTSSDAFELVAVIEWQSDETEIGIRLAASEREETIIGYNAKSGSLFIDRTRSGQTHFHPLFPCRHEAPLHAEGRKLKLRLFIDRCSVEVFANDGELVMTDLIFPADSSTCIEMYASGGLATLLYADVYALDSGYD